MDLDAELDVSVDESVTFTLRVANPGPDPAELTFRSGKEADVAVLQDGEAVWRWSDGRMFTQAMRMATLDPGESHGVTLTWDDPTPGRYTAVGTLAVDEPVEARAEFEV